MMKRRRLLLIIIAAVLVPLVGLGVYLTVPPKPGVTVENFRRLHRGMTKSQVEAILGTDGTSSPYGIYGWRIVENWETASHSVCMYYSEEKAYGGCLFDETHFVAELADGPEPVLEKFRRRFKEWTGW